MKFTDTGILISSFEVRYYGILIALGVFAALLTMAKRERLYGLKPDTSLDVALWVVPIGLVFARAYYVAFEWDFYKNDLMQIFNIRAGGMAIYGSVIGGILAGFLYSRIKRRPFLTLADLAAPALALGQAIGRWGNFVNQEAYGNEILNPALQFFPLAVYINSQNAWFEATFFYESLTCLIIFATILIFERKQLFTFNGAAALCYAIMYSAERSIVEGLRTDSLYLGGIRVSQALSAAVLIASCLYLIFRIRKSRVSAIYIALAALSAAALIAGVFNAGTTFTVSGALVLLAISAMCLRFENKIYQQK